MVRVKVRLNKEAGNVSVSVKCRQVYSDWLSVPGKGKSRPTDMESLKPLLLLVFYYVEKVSRFQLSKEVSPLPLHTLSVSLCLSLSLSPSLSHSLSLTHSLSLSLSLSHTHYLSHSLPLSLTLFLSLTLTLSLFLSHSLSPTLSLSFSLPPPRSANLYTVVVGVISSQRMMGNCTMGQSVVQCLLWLYGSVLEQQAFLHLLLVNFESGGKESVQKWDQTKQFIFIFTALIPANSL